MRMVRFGLTAHLKWSVCYPPGTAEEIASCGWGKRTLAVSELFDRSASLCTDLFACSPSFVGAFPSDLVLNFPDLKLQAF